MSVIVTIGVFMTLFLLSGLFSGSEIALFSLSRASVKKLQQEKRKGALAVTKLKENPHRLLVTILIGNNIVNIYTAALATQITIGLFGSSGVGIATGVVTFLILIFGEIFPKTLAQSYAEIIALRVSRPLLFLSYILWPIVLGLEKMSKSIVKLIPGDHEASMEIEEEIDSLLHIGLEEGSTDLYEHDYIKRLFKFNDTAVRDVMVPYKEAVMVNGEEEISQIAHFMATSGYSRFPVYYGHRNNVIGMVHVKDVFRANNSDRRRENLKSIAREPVTVATKDKLDDAFNKMKKKRVHSALVINTDSVVVGFVTMEDILERLVGDIEDESDQLKQ